jgi:hypothetical protein
MRTRAILGEVLPVVGTTGLLGLWLYQQIGIDARNAELRKLASARAVYQTYQSNNAMFNAIGELAKQNTNASNRISYFQIYSYELGLSAIEDVLADSERSQIPKAPPTYDPSLDLKAAFDSTQERLMLLQERLSDKEIAVGKEAATAENRYLWGFVTLSLISITGAICKVLDKTLGTTTK